ncbi:oligosaccharide flippase family protein [Xenorhabdus sp. IM139775]|uniref:oligosaccharide flippase family protein n=1 Tax=Xenorhabdus sp. IM139775 TaxID=3025876 RepID=UPI00235984C3|nr:oligosaccharide flippase family protein [Xenorhabdus sp. IM139775]MDC9592792.1 oligosaccharide flippase family protein [Xenorhabdus sp. IM139775]
MKKIIFNSMWLIFERLTNIIGGLLVTIYVARYLGPENMGLINYSLAIGALIVPISQLGSDVTIFNRAAKKEASAVILLKTTNNLRLIICIILIILSVSYFYIKADNKDNTAILTLMMAACLFTSLDIYRYFFDGILKSKLNSIAAQLGIYLSLFTRFFFVKLNLCLIYFTVPFILSVAIPFFIRYKFFSKLYKNISFKKIKRKKNKYNKYLIYTGIPLTLSSLSIVFYTKINQIFIGEYLDMGAVGIFNAATTLSQGWSFIPIAIITSLFSQILRGSNKRLKDGASLLYLITILISAPIIIIMNLYSFEIIFHTYGNAFIDASHLLTILSISSFFSVAGTISYRTIIAMGGYKFVMYKMFIMAGFNIILNIILIKYYGVLGAVYATLITEFIGATVANFFFKKGIIFKCMIHTFFPRKYINSFLDSPN